MLDLESQICALEYAKRLDELGVNQESYFFWVNPDMTVNNVTQLLDENSRFIDCHPDLYFSAFTASELGEILPNTITLPDCMPFDNYRIFINKFYSVNEDRSLTNNYIVNYECDSTSVEGENAWIRRKLTNNFYDANFANALAKMLIYLMENGLV